MAPRKKLKHKNNRLEREQHLDEVSRLRCMGLTQYEIADRTGVSQQQICYDIKVLRQRLADSQLANRQELVNEKLTQLRVVRREAFRALELSAKDFVRVVIEESDSGDGNIKEKRITTTEARVPAGEYLRIILDTIKQERDLLGIDESKPLDITMQQFDWTGLATRLGNRGEPLPDTIEGKVQALLTQTAPAASPAPKVVQQVPGTNGTHNKNGII